ncbi:helix-turn-helix domain-containing protein [Thioalkalivibrio sp. ALE11]|uniref:helix-turn-helix domain-containing protein n=1 Tax=Thioalkalivibrio sp. ALE11 TaxID=1265494 RepID=UPI0009DB6562
MSETFAQRLSKAIKQSGFTQDELAARANVSQQTIQYLSTRGTSSKYTTTLARILGVSAIWLSDGTGDMRANALPTRLREARERAGMTHKQVSRKCTLPPASISAIENGRKYNPEHLPLLANALGVSTEWLVYGEGNVEAHQTSGVVGARGGLFVPRLTYEQAANAEQRAAAKDTKDWVVDWVSPRKCSTDMFSLEVRDRALQDAIQPTDILIFSSNLEPDPGDIIAAIPSGHTEVILGRYHHIGFSDSGSPIHILRPDNPVFPALRLDDATTISGIAIEHRKSLI